MSKPTQQLHYINSQQVFAVACQALSQNTVIAIDTEFERRSTYYPVFALLQMADDSHSYVVDTLEIEDWKPLANLLQSDTLVLMHSCTEDLEVLRRNVGCIPKNLLDTQIACAFVGKGESVGYANMVMSYTDSELDKSQTRSDWLQRPLTALQIEYAHADVTWLMYLYPKIKQEIASLERTAWVKEQCDMLLQRYIKETPSADAWKKLKALHRIDPKKIAVASAMADWRERKARKRNLPKPWVMKDAELLDIVNCNPTSEEALKRVPEISQSSIRHHAKDILATLAKTDLPAPSVNQKQPLSQSQRDLLKKAQAIVRQQAESVNIAARFIANKDLLREFVHDPSSIATKLTAWQQQLVAVPLQTLLTKE